MKEGDYEEFGDVPSDGGQSLQVCEWDQARANDKLGTFDDIPSNLYIRYKNALHSIFDDACKASEFIV
jgi:hypothetical protein